MSEDTGAQQEAQLPANKAELLERIGRARAELDALIESLADEQLTRAGREDGWSVKDHLGHLTAWQQGIVELLQHKPRHVGMELTEEEYLNSGMDVVNELLHQRSGTRSLSEVLALFGQSHAELLATLEQLPEEDLFKPYSYFQPGEPGKDSGDPILGWIAGNTYDHYEEHIGWIRQRIIETD